MATKTATSGTGRDFAPPTSLGRFGQRSLGIGIAAAAAAVAGLFLDRDQFFRSYLVAFLWVIGFPLGCLAVAMLHHVTKGAWGVVIRRILEASTRTLPFVAVLFVPVILGMGTLFKWTDPEYLANDDLVAAKTPYLNESFFLIRAAIFFAIWLGLAFYLNRASRRQDETGEPSIALRLQFVSAIGLGLYVLTSTFASVDWLMSLDAHWFSSIYGIYFVGGHTLTAVAFVVPVAMLLGQQPPMDRVYKPSHFHDFGKLMLAFMMLWAYFSLSQFIIIWSGNLPEDIPFYMDRTQGVWKIVSQVLVFLHFVLPFLLLLSTDLKRDARRLAAVAILLLAMRWVDLYWQAAPAMELTSIHWLDFVLPIALGGPWLWLFFRELGKRPLLPPREPFLQEALDHE